MKVKERRAVLMRMKQKAVLALIVRNGKLLLGEKIRKDADIGEGTYNGPGGKREAGQDMYECLCTETFDEVGIQVDSATRVATVTFHNGNKSVWEVHMYLVHTWRGDPRPSPEMAMPADGWWHDVRALPFSRMLSSDKEWLPRVLGGERFLADVYQTEDGKELLAPVQFYPY
jgi:8-oxo-dGTP pyrophosphatase MutT (NUDIX family)